MTVDRRRGPRDGAHGSLARNLGRAEVAFRSLVDTFSLWAVETNREEWKSCGEFGLPDTLLPYGSRQWVETSHCARVDDRHSGLYGTDWRGESSERH